jgi:hypothetical protein
MTPLFLSPLLKMVMAIKQRKPALLFLPITLRLMFAADCIEHFLIDSLPVYRLAFSFKLFDHSLHHLALDYLLSRYALASLPESAEILINSHCKPPMPALNRFIHAFAFSMAIIIAQGMPRGHKKGRAKGWKFQIV